MNCIISFFSSIIRHFDSDLVVLSSFSLYTFVHIYNLEFGTFMWFSFNNVNFVYFEKFNLYSRFSFEGIFCFCQK